MAPVSNTDIRDILRGVARGAKAQGDMELWQKASRSGRLIVGGSWSRKVEAFR